MRSLRTKVCNKTSRIAARSPFRGQNSFSGSLPTHRFTHPVGSLPTRGSRTPRAPSLLMGSGLSPSGLSRHTPRALALRAPSLLVGLSPLRLPPHSGLTPLSLPPCKRRLRNAMRIRVGGREGAGAVWRTARSAGGGARCTAARPACSGSTRRESWKHTEEAADTGNI